VIEAVGTQESMMQAIRSAHPGGHVGFVGVTHDVAIPGLEYFFWRDFTVLLPVGQGAPPGHQQRPDDRRALRLDRSGGFTRAANVPC
jgi:threonine dehydrogenase-like Zn-dependent dehydrogenase